MTIHDVFGIVSVVCWIVAVVAMLYYHTKGDVVQMVARFIALAEETGQPGPDKMAMVVDWMYKALPTPFRSILTREKLREIAQYVFDWTRRYALDYLESKKKSGGGEILLDEVEDDTFIQEYDIVPEICDSEDCPDDACPIFPDKK